MSRSPLELPSSLVTFAFPSVAAAVAAAIDGVDIDIDIDIRNSLVDCCFPFRVRTSATGTNAVTLLGTLAKNSEESRLDILIVSKSKPRKLLAAGFHSFCVALRYL